MRKPVSFTIVIVMLLIALLAACGGGEAGEKVCVVLDTGGENDKSFNEYTLKGAREAAEEEGFEFSYVVSEAATDYRKNIDNFISEGCGLIITVGFLMGDDTKAAALENPDTSFAIIDVDYWPGFGCDEGVDSCYTEAGGLTNVTSLMFAEDQVGCLAGALAGCMTETGVIGSVSGMEIPPVVKFVVGYQTCAKRINPDVETLNIYIPDFNDPATGKEAGQAMLANGADVIFGVGGNTGNGGLLAAHEQNMMCIGVDVDQYFTYPDVAPCYITSAQKNMDVAAGLAVQQFAGGTLEAGISLSTLGNEGIGLAPYHDWDAKIPQECKDIVDQARQELIDRTWTTGY